MRIHKSIISKKGKCVFRGQPQYLLNNAIEKVLFYSSILVSKDIFVEKCKYSGRWQLFKPRYQKSDKCVFCGQPQYLLKRMRRNSTFLNISQHFAPAREMSHSLSGGTLLNTLFWKTLKITFFQGLSHKIHFFGKLVYFRIPTINVHIYWEYERKCQKNDNVWAERSIYIFRHPENNTFSKDYATKYLKKIIFEFPL